MKSRFPRGHYQAYAPQLTAGGARLVEYGRAGISKLFKKELESVVNEQTCCLSYTLSYNPPARGEIPLAEIIETCGRYEIPVVVDAAALLPPVANLHKFTDKGADIVIFSGGKHPGPATSGMMLGQGRGAQIIEPVRNHTYPHEGWARGFKVWEEQIAPLVGLALEIFIREGDTQYEQGRLQIARFLMNALEDIPHVDVQLSPMMNCFMNIRSCPMYRGY